MRDFPGFRAGYTVVAVDVIRATTTAVTAVMQGRRCFPAATIDAAILIAELLRDPLLAGELGGNMQYGFELDNSPAALAERTDTARPLVLASTSGTQLICEAAATANPTYVACLRNFSAQARHLLANQASVALVGAGSRGEFREEDQLCCAWIAEQLVAAGCEPEENTVSVIERWHGASVTDMLVSKSVSFLRATGRERDLDFILRHIDDATSVFQVQCGEIMNTPTGSS